MIKCKKNLVILIAASVAMAVLLCISGRFIYLRAQAHKVYDVTPLTEQKIKKPAENAEKLMIVAHPDDEVIWGGGHLMDGGYLIVCITNGRNEFRAKEFMKVVEKSGNTGIILDYPDKVNGRRDDWKQVYDGIYSDVNAIMEYKNWDMIVTHNKDGEYGHLHHKIVHKIVTEIYNKDKSDVPLYCFGKYFKKRKLPEVEKSLTPLNAQQITFKKKLEKLYASQQKTVGKLSHMNNYEMWSLYLPENEA